MTGETCIKHLRRPHLRKGADGGLAAAGLNMLLAGAMTTLAARTFRRFHTGGDALEVRILIEIEPDVRMASAAHVTPDVCIAAIPGRRRAGRLAVHGRNREQRHNKQNLLPAFHIFQDSGNDRKQFLKRVRDSSHGHEVVHPSLQAIA